MPSERQAPDSAAEWRNRAHSDLRLARARIEGVYLEDLCYHAQQAAEKALKALFISRGWRFPYVHDLADLVTRLEAGGIGIPATVRDAVALTEFAVSGRYPALDEPVSEAEYQTALARADAVVLWVETEAGKGGQT